MEILLIFYLYLISYVKGNIFCSIMCIGFVVKWFCFIIFIRELNRVYYIIVLSDFRIIEFGMVNDLF